MPRLLLVFILCCVPRLACLWWASPEEPGIYYWDLAGSLLSHGVLGFEGQPTSAFEPLYPLFLAAARWLTGDNLAGVLLLQVAVASLGGVYLYRLCQLLADERTARIAVLLFAFYPYLVWQSVNIIEITPLATLLIATAYYYCRGNAAAAGVLFGLSLLMRAAVLPAALLAIAFQLFQRKHAAALVMALATFAVALPYAWRNHQLDGAWLPTRGGENLYVGNSRYGEFVIPAYNLDLVSPIAHARLHREAPQLESGGEPAIDAFHHANALEWMRAEPWRALRLKLLNFAYFFHPRLVPYYALDDATRLVEAADGSLRVDGALDRSRAADWVHGLGSGFVLLSALAGIWLRRQRIRDDAILYLMLVGFAAVCMLYFPATRLRAPVEFVLMFFSAFALARWTHIARAA